MTGEKGEDFDPQDPVGAIIAEWQRAGMSALSVMSAPFLERMSGLGAEWMRFVADRIRQDETFQEAVMQARTRADLKQLQAEFIEAALEQYAAETGRIADLGRKLFTPPEENGAETA